MLVMSRGLYGQKYSGYFADSFTFFDTAAYIGTESTFTSINLGDEGSYYSYKWYGFIIPLATGTYTFQTVSDDASYVHIQGTEVVNNGSTHGEQTRSGTINLNAGTRYLIKIYFGENAGGASMNFSWSGGSQTSLTTDLTTDVLQFYPQSDTLLPINYGLVGWYKGEAWNGTSWPDLSGNGNHCTEIVPNCTINKAGSYIYGGTGDGIRFPSAILPSTYTLFHVARYNGAYRSRIFDGVAANWLSGFWGGRTGVAYHDGWLTQYGTTAFPLDQILISTDQKSLYRGNGVNLTINSVTGSAKNLSINYGHFTGERSDWAVWEVIVYDRELSLDEIRMTEEYFTNFYTNPVVPRGVNYFNPRDIVFYKKTGYSVNINKMTANTTYILGLGNVVASASSVYDGNTEAWKAFNGVTLSDFWHSATTYSTDGTYSGSASLGGYSGEWLKIEFPIQLFLNYSVLYARNTLPQRLVKNGYLLASNDDTNWSVVQYINRTPEAYTETSFVLVDKYIQRPFKYYAVVATKLFASNVVDSIQISEWYMDVKIPAFKISNTISYGLTFMDFNNWYTLFNRVSGSNWTIEQTGLNPDVQLKLSNYGTTGSYNYIWYKLRIQDYDYLRIEFEYSLYGIGDGTTFKIGCLSAGSVGGEHIRADAYNVNMQIYNGVNKFRIYKNGIVNIQETPLIKASSSTTYAWTPVVIIYNKSNYKTWTIYHNNELLLEYDDSDNDFWVNVDSGSFFGFGSRTGAATLNSYLRRFKMITRGNIQPNRQDGSTPQKAAYSARRLVEDFPELKDGVYWINLPDVGPTQIYCILNTDCAGGGWMLAMKGTRGTTFNFDSDYWTTANTLNPSDTNRNDGDAKFDTFNKFRSRDWMAIFPDTPVGGGDVSGGYGGWTWVQGSAVGNVRQTLREFYASPTQITKLSNGVDYPATNPTPTASSKFNSSIWSWQNGFQWYGINYTTYSPKSVRWGFAWNNEADQSSNDVTGGIGLKYASYSAGNAFNCCNEGNAGYTSMRFEWYVR